MEGRSQCTLAANLGTKLLARRVQERSFTTVGERAPMSTVAWQLVSTAIETDQSPFQLDMSGVLTASRDVVTIRFQGLVRMVK